MMVLRTKSQDPCGIEGGRQGSRPLRAVRSFLGQLDPTLQLPGMVDAAVAVTGEKIKASKRSEEMATNSRIPNHP